MHTGNKAVRVWILLMPAFLVSACFDLSTPALSEPQTLPPSPTPILLPLEATLTPFRPEMTVTLTPPILLADTPIPSITPTFTSIPSPTNTNLPPLPDIGQILAFGGGGAGPEYDPCEDSLFPPPVVFAKRSPGVHVVDLCVYQIALPVNAPIHLTLTSPDGTIGIQGDFQSPGMPKAYWLGFENEDYYSYAENCKQESCSKWLLQFWWPANLPAGTWRVHLSWNGGEVFGTFNTNTDTTLPELSVQDGLAQSVIRPAVESLEPCHPVASSVGLMVAGRGFPANAVVYVPVFEDAGNSLYRFINAQTFVADGDGAVYGALTGPFQSGKSYALAGVTDATLSLVEPDQSGVIIYKRLHDALDCFIVP